MLGFLLGALFIWSLPRPPAVTPLRPLPWRSRPSRRSDRRHRAVDGDRAMFAHGAALAVWETT